MEKLLVNHKGELIQVTPILHEPESTFVINDETNEGLWIDNRTGEIKEDELVTGD